jgi:Zn-dependent protease with chaperone function
MAMPPDDAPAETPLPAPRHLAVPSRADLVRLLREHDLRSRGRLVCEAVAACGCLAWVVARGGPPATLETAVLVAVAALGLFDALPGLWASNRKRLRDIRADARFGPHTRNSLLASVARVAERLGLDAACPVYLVRDKDVNAHALPMSLLPGVGSLAAVHLNRSVLHLLDEAELESVIGHELAHVFVFPPPASRWLLLHAAFAAAITLALADLLAGSDLRYAAPLLALWPARWLAFSQALPRIRATEFLCDQCGAVAAGTPPAMTAQLKIALEQEARAELVEQVLEARLQGVDVPLARLLDTYEAALPFGGVAPDEARAAIRAGIDRLARRDGGLSLLGFWRYLAAGHDADDRELHEAIASGRAIRGVARTTVGPRDVLAGRATLADCVAAIEAEPTRVLVHLPDEVEDRGSTHPNTSRRLLSLWRS